MLQWFLLLLKLYMVHAFSYLVMSVMQPYLMSFPSFRLVVKACMLVVQTFNKFFSDFLVFQFTSRMVEIARSTLVLSSGAAILPHPSKVIISLYSLLPFMHFLHLTEGQKAILLARSQ
jgi:hypothetical protein